MEMLAAVDYDVAARFVRALGESVVAGTEVAVVGVDRDRVKRVTIATMEPRVAWSGSESVIRGLLEGAGFSEVVGMPPEEPWLFEVWATR